MAHWINIGAMSRYFAITWDFTSSWQWPPSMTIEKSIDGIEKSLEKITGNKSFANPSKPPDERLDNIHKELDKIVQDIHDKRKE